MVFDHQWSDSRARLLLLLCETKGPCYVTKLAITQRLDRLIQDPVSGLRQ